MRVLNLSVLLLVACVVLPGTCFERSKFKTCKDSGFCRRQRERRVHGASHVLLSADFEKRSENVIAFTLAPSHNKINDHSNSNNNNENENGNGNGEPAYPSDDELGKNLRLVLAAGREGEVRVRIEEPGVDRHSVRDVVTPYYDVFHADHRFKPGDDYELRADPSPRVDDSSHMRETYTYVEITKGKGNTKNNNSNNVNTLRIYHDPLAIVMYDRTGRATLALNGRGLLGFETRRSKPEGYDKSKDRHSLWEESFGGNTDSKPSGPESVAVDIAFLGADQVYGIPERATSFALKPTVGAEPYRLYNLDVFEYETDHEFGLYGSVPVMYGHSMRGTAGVFWVNSAETWVDVGARGVDSEWALSAPGTPVGKPFRKRIDTQWISESGLLDVVLLPGPTPAEVFSTLSKLTGPAQMPPLFSLGYHQCRWNYRDEPDVEAVNSGFDEHDIPMDVLWLDIEHTDGKRYFTWDDRKFPHPEQMQEMVAIGGRKMVTIIDPHIKRDSNYYVHSEATSKRMYVRKPDGGDFEGHCWPGGSSYVDYTQSHVREWWAGLFSRYKGATKHLYTWVDMQEPSVFGSPNGAPEVTMPKDMVHIDGREHRDVHNVYGMYCQMAAFEGNRKLRPAARERPFVLARAFFAGSQRWGAVWTGDNTAEWSHLRASTPMLLALGITGITFSGADVGGFFGNPDAELLVRWYQAAVYQPFFRGHAHIDTKRREPWLFGEDNTILIRNAITERYALLPYLYTLFHETARNHRGPVMRPLWYDFPRDSATFANDDAFLLGPALLVRPVYEKGAGSVAVTLPGDPAPFDTTWYDLSTGETFRSGEHVISVGIHSAANSRGTGMGCGCPVFIRGGSVLPRRERRRRSSRAMYGDPYTIVVAADDKGTAKGILYTDNDGIDFDQNGDNSGNESVAEIKEEYALIRMRMSEDGTIKGFREAGSWAGDGSVIERFVIMGWKKGKPRAVTAEQGGNVAEVPFIYDNASGVITVKNPHVRIADTWIIKIHN